MTSGESVAPRGFVVLGAGLPRTGTNSLQKALEQLLGGPCYHMQEFFATGDKRDVEHWRKALKGKVDEEDWRRLLTCRRAYRCGVDFPISFYWRDLLKVYPEAKVILTVRKPETWATSVNGSIRKLQDAGESWPVTWFTTITGRRAKSRVAYETCWSTPAGCPMSVNHAVQDEEQAVKFFNEWNESVIREVPADRLLIFESKDGWEPLCKFLGVPVPANPYPRVNNSQSKQDLLWRLKAKSYLTVVGIPLLATLAGLTWFQGKHILSLLENFLRG